MERTIWKKFLVGVWERWGWVGQRAFLALSTYWSAACPRLPISLGGCAPCNAEDLLPSL